MKLIYTDILKHWSNGWAEAQYENDFTGSFLTSLSVEPLQYVFSCGKSETDDVITNVLGALIGYMLIYKKEKL